MEDLLELPRFVGNRASDSEFLGDDVANEPAEIMAGKRVALLLGEPGSGKSTVARSLVANGKRRILEDLKEHSEATLEARIVEVLSKQPKLLILDSLDEWPGTMSLLAGIVRRRVLPALDGGLNLVATCRTGDVSAALLDVFRAANKSVEANGTDDSFTFHLLPLRRSDAEVFIEGHSLNSATVLSKLADFDAEALAANVGLLDLVCQTIEFDDAVLESRASLFDSAVLRALDLTVRASAQPGSTLEPSKLVRIAERAAGITLLGGRSSVRIEGLCRPGESPFEELLSGWGTDAPTLSNDTSLVLRSPLFTQFGSGARTFAHKSIASYLAARFIHSTGLSVDQVSSLVMTPPEAGVDAAVIPQLRETCAWLLVLDSDRFGWLIDADPYSLSRYGAVIVDGSVTARIVDGLLNSANDLVFKLNRSDSFAGLAHDRLGQQLEDALTGTDETRRNVAVRILSDAYVVELEAHLQDLVGDSATDFETRIDVVRLLIREGRSELLVPHIDLLLEADRHHEILGSLVAELWPNHWPTSQMLASLKPPEKLYFGSYRMALIDLPDRLPEEDLAEALSWTNGQVTPNSESNGEVEWLADLATSILKRLSLKDALAIGKPVMAAYWRILSHHRHLPVALTGRSKKMVLSLISSLVAEQPGSESAIYFLAYAQDSQQMPVLGPASIDWLQEQAENTTGRTRRAWLHLLRNRLNPSDNATLERVWKFRDKPDWDLFSPWFAAVELDSEMANNMKEGAKIRAELQSLKEERAKETQFIANKLAEACEAAKSQPDRFWVVVRWLDAGGPEIGTDILGSTNLELLDDGAQSQLIDGAADYLASLSSNWLPRFEFGVHSRPLVTACRAATTLLIHAPERLDKLGADVWKSLIEPVVTFPAHYANTEIDRALVEGVLARLAKAVDPTSLVSGFRSALEIHEAKGERFHGLKLAEGFTGEEWTLFLAEQIEVVGPSNFERIMEMAFQVVQGPALARCELVVRESTNPTQISEAVLLIANHFPSIAGGLFLELFERDPELARSVTLSLAPARRWQGTVLGGEPAQLAEIYERLRALFPPENDPSKLGFHTVTPSEDAGELRDSLLSTLVDAGTSDAVQSVRRLRDDHPEWDLQGAWIRARERLYQSAWAPVTTAELQRLIAEQRARMIRSVVELRRVAIETLDELQAWLHGEIPQAFALWNAASIPGHPKDENSVSDWYCHGLRLLLDRRNIVVNREVEVTRGTGAGMGSRNDIRLDAVGEDGVLSVVIEVKGCWNPKLRDGVQKQLDVRYLTEAHLTHGIYLVVCFPADQMEKPTNYSRHDPKSLRRRIDGYLTEVKNDIAIVVHDARLPQVVGKP